MKNTYTRFIALLSAVLLFLAGPGAAAQQGKAPVKKVQTVQVNATVVNTAGQPIAGAVITAGEGAITRYTDAEGKFSINAKENSIILIEALGYKDLAIDLRVNRNPESITLTEEPYLSGEKDMLQRPDGRPTTQHDLSAAISTVDVNKVRSYPDLNLSNALQGLAPGLIVRANTHGIGNNTSSIYIRGQHASGTAAIVVVDGIERSLDDLAAEEIGSIEVLKDAAAKVLYGARAANGVLLITTKRGEANKRIIRASAEYGVTPTQRVPEKLGVNDYVALYNEARVNDGLAPYYTDAQILGYANSTGENDFLYPSVDWYKKFIGDMGFYRKASVEFIGGNEGAKYAVVGTYTGGDGIEKVQRRTGLNRFNVRGNLDIRINDFLTAQADVAARLEKRDWGGVNNANIITRALNLRPNEYPIIIEDPSLIGMEPNEDGTPYFGASVSNTGNLYMDAVYGGYMSERYVNTQTNLGLKFDFDKYVKGLYANAFITFDNYNFVQEGLSKNFATYAVDSYVDETGADTYRAQMVKKVNQSSTIGVNSETTKRTLGFRFDAGWNRTFGVNELSATAAYRYYNDEVLGANQDIIVTNGTLRLNWSFDKRFLVEGIIGFAGSNQFASNNRYLLTPVLSLGWVLSNEGFLKGSSAVNYLKLKASAGQMGAYTTSYLLYDTAWVNGGEYAIGATNNNSEYYTNLVRVGNPFIGWVTDTEANAGMEGIFMNNRLRAEANVFYEMRQGLIGTYGKQYSAIVGDYTHNINYGQVNNAGVDLGLSWSDSAAGGDLRYTFGINFTYTKNKVIANNELDNIEDYRKSVGRPTSGIFGLEHEGLFGKEVALAGHAKQYFGYYTDGDIAYKDQNNDNIVDDRDETYLGQSFPLTSWGATIDLRYKGFGFYALCTAETGASKMLNNAYYWNTGANGYTVKAAERYHAVNNPTGTLPRLTTTAGSNSYRDSSFWLADASFLRLKNIELSYTLDNRKADGFFKQCRLFLRGTNVFVLGAIKDLDPEMTNSGVTNFPVYSTYTGGLTVSF